MMRSSFWTRGDKIFPIVGLSMFAALFVYLSTDVRENIYVSSIDIPDQKEGDPVLMKVIRSLSGSWPGGYRVMIYSGKQNEPFCDTGEMLRDYSELEPDGSPRVLPKPLKLSWWAYGGTCTDKLKNDTLPAGLYSVKTCHGKRALPFIYRWHCWGHGPVFSVTE